MIFFSLALELWYADNKQWPKVVISCRHSNTLCTGTTDMISPFNISRDSFLHLEGSSATDFDAHIGLLISKICQKFLSILSTFSLQ